MLKVAILEASHWHVPLYLSALHADGIDVVAVSDADGHRGSEVASQFSAPLYSDYIDLLDREKVDFAFVFGRHCNMARMGLDLVSRGIAFSIEKPGGVNAAEVSAMKHAALARNLFVSVPFIFRVSELMHNLKPLGGPGLANWHHMSFRFIGGPIERYLQMGCDWMLQQNQSGGGCTINLGVHFIDLMHVLLGEDVRAVSAKMMKVTGPSDVEVFSSMMLQTTGGRICNLESGYTYPGGTKEQREISFTLASETHYARSCEGGFELTRRDGPKQQNIAIAMETDDYYAVYVRDVLERFQKGQNPSVGLNDLERVMRVIDCAYTSDRQGGKLIDCPIPA